MDNVEDKYETILKGKISSMDYSKQHFFNSLLKLHKKRAEIEKTQQIEIEQMEKENSKIIQLVDQKRANIIINGEIIKKITETTNFNFNEDNNETIKSNLSNEDIYNLNKAKGIPDFWQKVLLNDQIINKIIQKWDLNLLSYINNITSESLGRKSFRINFWFSKNPFFSNEYLSKTILMNKDDNKEIEKIIGSEIKWYENMNVTITISNKKSKKTGKLKTIIEERESFFNYFKTRNILSEKDQQTLPQKEVKDALKKIEEEFEISQEIINEIIPNSIFYYFKIAKSINIDSSESSNNDNENEKEAQTNKKNNQDNQEKEAKLNNENNEASNSNSGNQNCKTQ